MLQRRHGDAVGGPYVAVHLRRRDFLYSHREKVPSLASAARHIRSALSQYNLTSVFVATDAPTEGFAPHHPHVCMSVVMKPMMILVFNSLPPAVKQRLWHVVYAHMHVPLLQCSIIWYWAKAVMHCTWEGNASVALHLTCRSLLTPVLC